jgi:hypothetical protein
MKDHPNDVPPAQSRSGCALSMGIVASVLVAIPLALVSAFGKYPSQLLATIDVCLVVIGVAVAGGGIGWLVSLRAHSSRRRLAVATCVVVAMSALYGWYIWFGMLTRLGQWNW